MQFEQVVLTYGAESDRDLGIPGEVCLAFLVLKDLLALNNHITRNSIHVHSMFNDLDHLMKIFANGFFYCYLYIFQVFFSPP